VLNFRKVAAASDGKKVLDYYTEGASRQTASAEGLDPAGRELQSGEVLATYYTGPSGLAILRPDMPQSVAKALGLDTSRTPTSDELARLFEAKRADTAAAWSEETRKNSGFDLVFSPHKSVSLAAEFAASPAETAAIRNAVLAANQDALRYAAKDLGVARRGHAGEGGVEQGEIGWFSFIHDAARPTVQIQDGPSGGTYVADAPVAGDPHFHIHNNIPNLVVTEQGHIGSIDARALTASAVHEYGAYFQARLADRLRTLGARVGYDEKEQAVVLTAIPKDAVDLFSKRDRQVLGDAKTYAREKNLDWDSLDYDYKMKILHEASKAGRLGKTKEDAHEFWREQAASIGWTHESVMNATEHSATADEERFERAYEHAAQHLAKEFVTAAVIDEQKLRVHAARGLIGTGISGGREDVDRVVTLLMERGLTVNGVSASLVTGMRKGTRCITHAEQIRIEMDLALMAQRAAHDTSGALSTDALRAAIQGIEAQDAGIRFSGEQRAAIFAMGQGSKLTMLTGVAGSGKTTLLRPLVTAWKTAGKTVVGTSTAWRQADALNDAEIEENIALQPLLRAIDEGKFQPNENTVLVVDEVSQIAPARMLKLIELQATTGMTIKMLGDREQCQSIEAGDTIELLRRFLPKHALPEVLTSVRQKHRRDRDIAALFREGRTAEAFEMKREDGTARLVEGDYEQVVRQIADFVIERNDLLRSIDKSLGMTVTAMTNAEAADISRAIRDRLKQRGEIGSDETTHKAVYYRGEKPEFFNLPIATGDKLRLYRRTWSSIDGKGGTIGNNGDIVEVTGKTSRGLLLRNDRGQVGEVEWRRLRDPQTDRLLLGYGRVFTVDSAQGMSTKGEHLDAFSRGTHATTAFKAYTGESRATGRTFTFISKAAVLEDLRRKRAIGDITAITNDDLWTSIETDLAAKPYKGLGIDLLPKSQRSWESAVETSLRAHQRIEQTSQLGTKMLAAFDTGLARDVLSRLHDNIDQTLERGAHMIKDATELVAAHLGRPRPDPSSPAPHPGKPKTSPSAQPGPSPEPDEPAPSTPSPGF
jgi:hypothetical protein